MKKWKTILYFIAVVCAGLFLLNHFLEGIPGASCKCKDSMLMRQECEAVCEFNGGCFFTWYAYSYCIEYDCWTPTVNYCNEVNSAGYRVKYTGYHCYVFCSDCRPW